MTQPVVNRYKAGLNRTQHSPTRCRPRRAAVPRPPADALADTHGILLHRHRRVDAPANQRASSARIRAASSPPFGSIGSRGSGSSAPPSLPCIAALRPTARPCFWMPTTMSVGGKFCVRSFLVPLRTGCMHSALLTLLLRMSCLLLWMYACLQRPRKLA